MKNENGTIVRKLLASKSPTLRKRLRLSGEEGKKQGKPVKEDKVKKDG